MRKNKKKNQQILQESLKKIEDQLKEEENFAKQFDISNNNNSNQNNDTKLNGHGNDYCLNNKVIDKNVKNIEHIEQIENIEEIENIEHIENCGIVNMLNQSNLLFPANEKHNSTITSNCLEDTDDFEPKTILNELNENYDNLGDNKNEQNGKSNILIEFTNDDIISPYVIEENIVIKNQKHEKENNEIDDDTLSYDSASSSVILFDNKIVPFENNNEEGIMNTNNSFANKENERIESTLTNSINSYDIPFFDGKDNDNISVKHRNNTDVAIQNSDDANLVYHIHVENENENEDENPTVKMSPLPLIHENYDSMIQDNDKDKNAELKLNEMPERQSSDVSFQESTAAPSPKKK